jgi:hypothetical protein
MKRHVRQALAVGLAVLCAVANADSIGLSNRLASRPFFAGSAGGDPVLRMRQEIVGVVPSTADHPLFHTSYMGEEDRVIANTRYGPVTARDLYLWLTLREGPNKPYLLEALSKARTKSERELFAKQARQEISDYVFTNYVMPQLRPNEPADAESALKVCLYALPGYQLAFIKRIVEPQVCLLPGDKIKYLREHASQIVRPDRWRVRYIFVHSDVNAAIESQDAIETRLNTLRGQIATGATSFEQAARENSEAASRRNGGEIPAFGRGELFYLFEDTVSGMAPGEISPVFRGPGGFYLVQLIETIPADEPSLDNPEQALKVDEQLSRLVLRGAYDWELRDLFREKDLIMHTAQWDLVDDCDVVGKVCDFEITKQQFRIIYPAIESDDLTRRDNIINGRMRLILEREAMAQKVRAAGLDNDPLLVRSREIALNMVRYDNYVECLYRGLKVDEDLVHQFWTENPNLFTPLAMKHVVKVTMQPASIAPRPDQMLREMRHVMGELAEGSVPTPLTLDNSQTASSGIGDSSEDLIPVQGDLIETSDSIELRGGAAAEPAAGGSVMPSFFGSPDSSSTEVNPDGTKKKTIKNYSSQPPTPVFECDDTPENLIEDPRPTHVPPLPLGIYPRIQPTKLSKLVPRYRSTDFLLRYEDLGFIYIQDRPEIPLSVRAVHTGNFSKPILQGPQAVSYYIEGARVLPKPQFDVIKSEAYGIYRQVKVERQLQREYDREISKADISYHF